MRTIPTITATPDASTAPAARSATAASDPTWEAAKVIMDDPTTAGVLYSAWSGDMAVVAMAPPGSGKTRMVALLAAALASRAGLRVGIAAQTRDQAAELARRIGALHCPARLVWPQDRPAPDLGTGNPVTVARGSAVRFPASGGGVIIATTARWLYADPSTLTNDLMIIDEAWQATYADLGALGAFAAQIVCVGDPGQIPPVVTGTTHRWANSPTGPHLPGPTALLAAHSDTLTPIALRHTWRLGPTTTALIQPAFYPDLPFSSRRPPEHLNTASGTALPELSTQPVTGTAGPTDPAFTHACADAARTLLTGTLTTGQQTRPLTEHDLAVVTAHVNQAATVRALLSDLPHVLVGTANQLQGMERAAAVVLHPLAGYRDPTTFGTDLGRACVMLSRHRAHLHVITDTHTPAALHSASPEPTTAIHRDHLDALLHHV